MLTATVMGLQHAMAMLAGLTTVPFLIGNNAVQVSAWALCHTL
jgi:xanthine/uracil permease